MRSALQKIPLRALPLWMWGIGFLEFHLHTLTPLRLPIGLFSWICWVLLALAVIAMQRMKIRQGISVAAAELFRIVKVRPLEGCALLAAAFCLLAITGIGVVAARLPPHLMQEYDAIHYQMGIPWQHLVQRSLTWIDWSTADLWPMAFQNGIAPFSHLAHSKNKLPQFVFYLGVLGCLLRLPGLIQRRSFRIDHLYPALLLVGSHGVGIQIGTAMMDLPLLYFLLYGASRVLEGRVFSAALAFGVFSASKSFNILFFSPALAAITLASWKRHAVVIARKLWIRLWILFLTAFLILASRSIFFSTVTTGTPIYPLLPCTALSGTLCDSDSAPLIRESVREQLNTRFSYGHGRGPFAFARHLWEISLPSSGVNNTYDYPLGLSWIVLVLLLVSHLMLPRQWNGFTLLALVFWALWWMNAHQSRWLFPMMSCALLASWRLQKLLRTSLVFPVTVSCLLSLVSVGRAHQHTLLETSAAIRIREAAKVQWESAGKLISNELLYVDVPAPDHARGNAYWILRNK